MSTPYPAYDFVTVNVFTDRRFAGNPLAVLPEAEGLTDAEMQTIAAEFNFSETTFVLPPADPRHHARVRIFNRKSEMPFAGHPNIGTAFVLAARADRPPEHFVFEEEAGLVRVHVLRGQDGVIAGARVAAPKALSIGDALPAELVAACASLPEEAIVTAAHPPLMASVGIGFAIAEVASVEDLAHADPDLGAFREAAEQVPGVGPRLSLHLYTWTNTETRRLRTRMFAPLEGTMEDPATGSANAALAALLTSLAPGVDVALDYEIEQGLEMGRPSLILASARKEAEGPVTASVAGACVQVSAGRMDV